MNLKLKFLLNAAAIFLIFVAFKPGKLTKEDYFVSLLALAVTTTMAEVGVVDFREKKRNPTPQNERAFKLDVLVVVIGLMFTIASAFIGSSLICDHPSCH